MKVLVIGSGGREHAIAKKLLQDPAVTKVFCAPGNPGMKMNGIEVVPIMAKRSLIDFAKDQGIDWSIVGPEIPLLEGIVDDFQQAGLKIFGPTKAAAAIEGSKEFAKILMAENQIPNAAYQSFTEFEAAKRYVEKQGVPIVIKADGLAAGKGVVVAETMEVAAAALKEMLQENKFGKSGQKVVIEEFLAGEEFSLLAFVMGDKVYPMVPAKDHKRAFEGDQGPNTGGMGAYTPVPQITQAQIDEAVAHVLIPAARGMVQRGTPFQGILYAGLIATDAGVKVIEFNARFGDPETQVVLSRLESGFGRLLDDLLHEREPEIRWNDKASLGVVVAADGYPENYVRDMPVPIDANDECTLFYAGVTENAGNLVADGGRIFLVESTADTLSEAQQNVYKQLAALALPQMFYRRDIGEKASVDLGRK